MEKQIEDRIALESKFWNSKAQDYDKMVNKFFPKIYEAIFANIVQDVDQSQKILEAATGTGIISMKLSDHVPHITAIDIALEMLNIAEEKCTLIQKNNIDFEIGDICNLKFDDKSFDTVIASNILHLLFRPQLALQEMRRVLYDSGKIIVPTFCHGENLRSKILSGLLAFLGQKTKSRWGRRSFKEFIENNGFTITKETYLNDKIPLVYIVAIKK